MRKSIQNYNETLAIFEDISHEEYLKLKSVCMLWDFQGKTILWKYDCFLIWAHLFGLKRRHGRFFTHITISFKITENRKWLFSRYPFIVIPKGFVKTSVLQ